MRIVVKHYADPEETITAIPGKVTAHVEMEDGSEESTEPVVLTLGQQLTYVVVVGSPLEAYVDDTQIQAVLDPAPPAEGAMTERGAEVAEKVRRAMAETPQPWTSADLDEAIRQAIGDFVEVQPTAASGLSVNPTYTKALGTGTVTVGEPGEAAWTTAVEEVTQGDCSCILDGAGRVVALVTIGRDARAQFLADALNGAPTEPAADESIDNQIERAAIAMCELGQVEWEVQEEHRQEHFRQLARAAFGEIPVRVSGVSITPEEAKTLYAVWAGDAFDAQLLESVQPKLEAIAGESWR